MTHHHHVRPLRSDSATGVVSSALRTPKRHRLPGEPPSLLELATDLINRPRESEAQIKPLDFAARSGNELRPSTFSEMVGQKKLLPLLERLVTTAKATRQPLDHMLLLGSAGTGKTTLATVMAHELGRNVFSLKAPVALDVLEELAKVARYGDVVFVDEIHQQTHGDRRGVTQAADPEVWYGILEDKRLTTARGVVAFPDITLVGATTDAGLLPEPFLMRFPLQPRLDPYTVADMTQLARANASSLGVEIGLEAAEVFANASRGIPRIVNRYMKNAKALNGPWIERKLAVEIVTELNGVTLDGLDRDHQNMLRFLLRCPRTLRGEVQYQASVGSIATALGFSRDQKRVALYVEPVLIERGLVGVGHGGRYLTNTGIARAKAL